MDSTLAQPVAVGVIGLGNIAQQHIGNIVHGATSHCQLTAVCSRTSDSYAQSLGIPHFDDYRALCDSGLCEAVIIATPTLSHFAIGEYCLKAGLHVLMEKPLGLSAYEGEKLIALQQGDQIFALMLNQRTDPLFTTMHRLIDSGRIGDIQRCHWTMTHWFRPEAYFQVSDWRATWQGEGGGLLLNQCIHNLDIFQWLCGMPDRLRAHCAFGKYHDIEVEDEVTCYLEYTNGATGVFIGSTGEAPGFNRLDIVGDKGYLSFDGRHLTLGKNAQGTQHFGKTTRDMFGMPEISVADITPDRDTNQHANIVDNFGESIRGNCTPIAPASEGLPSLSLANAMLYSTWTDSSVSFPLDNTKYQRELVARIAQSQPRERSNIDVTIDMNKSYR